MEHLLIDGRRYAVSLFRNVDRGIEAPRLIIPAYQPSEQASEILRACIRSIQKFTPEPHELWVIDNNSPAKFNHWLSNYPGINVAFNKTEPLPKGQRSFFNMNMKSQMESGSYANAIGLEIGIRLIDQNTKYILPLHMDTMACKEGWLSFLISKLDDQCRAAGVRLDKARVPEGVLHVLGYIVDFQLFKQLGANFFPKLPDLDVGDSVSVSLYRSGYKIYSARNSLRENEVVDLISETSVYKTLGVDRTIDDENNVIFLHLGRGTPKALDRYTKGITVDEWLRLAEGLLNESI